VDSLFSSEQAGFRREKKAVAQVTLLSSDPRDYESFSNKNKAATVFVCTSQHSLFGLIVSFETCCDYYLADIWHPLLWSSSITKAFYYLIGIIPKAE